MATFLRVMKWILRILVALFVLGFLHYTLPQHDIVRIINTYNRLTTVGSENAWAYSNPDTGTAESTTTRDIRFIETVYENGKPMVYRNEDTGWIWPPYFKYDSSNLQAEAGNLKSTAEAPKWVVVTHYGWRLPFLSIYPNAVSVRPASGPDEQIIPYVSIIVVIFLIFIVVMIRRMWAQFWERTVEPAAANVEEAFDSAGARASGLWARIKRLFGGK